MQLPETVIVKFVFYDASKTVNIMLDILLYLQVTTIANNRCLFCSFSYGKNNRKMLLIS